MDVMRRVVHLAYQFAITLRNRIEPRDGSSYN